jgi:hypothetical protein
LIVTENATPSRVGTIITCRSARWRAVSDFATTRPISAPATTSDGKCTRSFTRAMATLDASVYAIVGTTYPSLCAAIAVASANAFVAWPEGKECEPENGSK